jgi:hypothetical protein
LHLDRRRFKLRRSFAQLQRFALEVPASISNSSENDPLAVSVRDRCRGLFGSAGRFLHRCQWHPSQQTACFPISRCALKPGSRSALSACRARPAPRRSCRSSLHA